MVVTGLKATTVASFMGTGEEDIEPFDTLKLGQLVILNRIIELEY